MQDEAREIEMQIFSLSYSYPLSQPSSLPFNWENEGSLVLNNNFYSHMEQDEFMLPDGKEPELLECMQENGGFSEQAADLESCSCPSTDATSNQVPLTTVPEVTTLDEQLEFIMESTKKPPKTKSEERKLRRNRKTAEQLAVLTKELAGQLNVTKEMIKKVSQATGLKEIQVYKWYWDHRAK